MTDFINEKVKIVTENFSCSYERLIADKKIFEILFPEVTNLDFARFSSDREGIKLSHENKFELDKHHNYFDFSFEFFLSGFFVYYLIPHDQQNITDKLNLKMKYEGKISYHDNWIWNETVELLNG